MVMGRGRFKGKQWEGRDLEGGNGKGVLNSV